MLLSIVECGDYRLFNGVRTTPERVQLKDNVDCIGPVLAANVAAMRNQGASYSNAEWFFFKDADCNISVDALLKSIERQQGQDVIGGQYIVEKTNYLGQAYHWIQKQWVASGTALDPRLLGGALLVRRSVFQSLNGFDESIGWGGEETEFVGRLVSSGFSGSNDDQLQVVHDNKMTFCGFLKRAWMQNFHRGKYQLPGPKSTRSLLNYFKAPVYCWPAICLFFAVGFVANQFGKIAR